MGDKNRRFDGYNYPIDDLVGTQATKRDFGTVPAAAFGDT
jgi:hypothetical protein